jgi:hypothetical protein
LEASALRSMKYKPTNHSPVRRSTRRTLSRHGARLGDSQALHPRAAGRATSAGLIRMITPRRARGSGQSGCATWAWRRCRAIAVRSSRLLLGWPRGRGRRGPYSHLRSHRGSWVGRPHLREPDPPEFPRLLWSIPAPLSPPVSLWGLHLLPLRMNLSGSTISASAMNRTGG